MYSHSTRYQPLRNGPVESLGVHSLSEKCSGVAAGDSRTVQQGALAKLQGSWKLWKLAVALAVVIDVVGEEVEEVVGVVETV